MLNFKLSAINFCRNQSGATSIEYALLASLVGLGIVEGARVVGDEVEAKFRTIGNLFGNSGPAGASAPTNGGGGGGAAM